MTIQGKRQYLWRAVDQDGDVIARKLLKGQGSEPRWLVTDKLRSHSAAHRTRMPSVLHVTERYANNQAEVSHQPTRQRERPMRKFKSAAQAQHFLWVTATSRISSE